MTEYSWEIAVLPIDEGLTSSNKEELLNVVDSKIEERAAQLSDLAPVKVTPLNATVDESRNNTDVDEVRNTTDAAQTSVSAASLYGLASVGIAGLGVVLAGWSATSTLV
jgi:hypothetical protein